MIFPRYDRPRRRKKHSPAFLDPPGRRTEAGVAALPIDSGAWLSGEVDRNIPPTRLRFVGRDNFTATGCEFLRYFTEYGGMKPDNSVLDVGCGIGRMAIPMTNYLKRGTIPGIRYRRNRNQPVQGKHNAQTSQLRVPACRHLQQSV